MLRPKKAVLISDKGGFRAKTLTWDHECHFIMLQVSIHQEDITATNHKCLCT